jgi:hypothetical protein
MFWFLAKLVYEIHLKDTEMLVQFDEQLRVIFAKDWTAALERARQIGRMEEDASELLCGFTLRWKFMNVTELNKLTEDSDGIELYGRVIDVENPAQFRKEVQRDYDIAIGENILRGLNIKN